MIPNDILNALMSGTEVKISDNLFKDIYEPYKDKPTVNCFTVYQIEQGSVNIYNEGTEEVYNDISFKDISLF